MKPSDFQKTVQCRFESCLKKVVRHIVKDYQQGLKRRKGTEVSFCELPESVIDSCAVWDDYETDYTLSLIHISFTLAENFAREKSGGQKVTYTNPIAVAKNGGWRYGYGLSLIHI